MKSLIIAATIFAAAAPALAQNVTITIGEPNFYGRLDTGGYSQPRVYFNEPVIVERQARYGQPVYLRVPEGHRKHWSKNCRKYNACNQQVFFVQDSWYNNTYAPRYREQHGRADKRAAYRDERRDDRRDDRRDHRGDDRGHGKGHDKHDKQDKGHGKGHDKH
ncbi:hypothetical protein CR105_17595 [Massilia eurypsychrophila]|jgi:hypothetical protein|uniref:Uncharacterized protein n=1 Tax=Massilia eurypsychrophila TaxID=1485217 RepID=A0A2G8TCZ5_9BURK|nr:hypothetical protein [Massilia eurypsychrophila]PIL43839.1 hypothetical protein CR105_17595 [Massilia eurypsychrophila]